MLRHKGDLDAALADWDTAIRLDPARAYPRMRRAEVLRERDDVDGALAEYDILIARDAKDREPRLRRAEVLRDKGDFDGALAEYDGIVESLREETATKSDVASAAFFARVATLREKGAIDAALAEVEKGIAIWPHTASRLLGTRPDRVVSRGQARRRCRRSRHRNREGLQLQATLVSCSMPGPRRWES